jgi:hypothetical protein
VRAIQRLAVHNRNRYWNRLYVFRSITGCYDDLFESLLRTRSRGVLGYQRKHDGTRDRRCDRNGDTHGRLLSCSCAAAAPLYLQQYSDWQSAGSMEARDCGGA